MSGRFSFSSRGRWEWEPRSLSKSSIHKSPWRLSEFTLITAVYTVLFTRSKHAEVIGFVFQIRHHCVQAGLRSFALRSLARQV